MEWNVKPTEKVNNILFGANRESVRAELGMPIKEFKKSKFSKNTTDDYGEFHMFYDANNNLEALEVFGGLVKLEDRNLFPGTIEEIMQLDESFEREEDGCISVNLQIGVYAPTGTVESVLIGGKGYY